MYYFMRNGKLHKNPAPLRCSAIREGERLIGSIPEGYKLCFKEEERVEQRRE